MNRNKNVPPKLANRFLHWFLRENIAEEVEGDLEEQFYAKLKNRSLRKAKLDYWYQVFNYLRPFAIKHLKTSNMSRYALLNSYAKISWRNLLKQKLYSSINIGGLAIGLASFILILLYVEHELTYDQFYSNSEKIHRIVNWQSTMGESDKWAVTPAPLATLLEQEFPEVKKATSISNGEFLLIQENNSFWEKGIWADKNYFEVFNYPLLVGEPKKVLAEPNSIVISETLAAKFFAKENPIGKSIKLKVYYSNYDFMVTGLMPDVPEKSSLKFQFIASLNSRKNYVEALNENLWNNSSYVTFFLLEDGANPKELENKIKAANIPQKFYAYEPEEDEELQYLVEPLLDLHLEQAVSFDVGLKGDKNYIYFYSVLAFLILILACINYMNLAIARSINRAREVGLRKVIGAFKNQIIAQFLGEAVLITLIAFVLSLVLVQLILPLFSDLIERPLTLDLLENSLTLPAILLLLLAVGIFSGSYPAFFMSALQPVKVLKGKIDSRSRNSGLQRVLVVLQYTVSISLIISSFVIYQQMEYIQTKELGYNKEHVITVPIKDTNLRSKIDVIKNEWAKNPNLLSVAHSSGLPVDVANGRYIDEWDGKQLEGSLFIKQSSIGVNYLNLFEIELIAGRNFNLDTKSDYDVGTILNETAVRALGWTPEKAIGKQFIRNGNQPDVVVGVVKDFNLHSLHEAINPFMFKLCESKHTGVLSAKVKPDQLRETIEFLESTITPHTDYPFEYAFLDDKFDQLYKNDIRLGQTFGFFTILAILIASLGLFGLAAFTTKQRTKEIGIRKVLGASPLKIFSLLAENFLKLIAIAFVLSIPLAWYGMEKWLENFAFRIDIEWWMFAITGMSVLFIAYFTIGYQSIKAALLNPVDSLRSE